MIVLRIKMYNFCSYIMGRQQTKYAHNDQGQNRDKQGQNRDKQGQNRNRQGQTKDSRDKTGTLGTKQGPAGTKQVQQGQTGSAGTKQGQPGTKQGHSWAMLEKQKSPIIPDCPCLVPAWYVPVFTLLICPSLSFLFCPYSVLTGFVPGLSLLVF